MLRQPAEFRVGLILASFLALVFASEVGRSLAPSLGSVAVAQDEEAAEEAAPTEAPKKKNKQSMLAWTYEALGIRYTVSFLGISFAFVALAIMNALAIRRDAFVPQHLVDGFEAHCNEKRYQEAYEMAKADESFLGHMFSAGLARLQQGYSQAIEAMQEVGEEENMKLEHRLSYIAMIGTVAPMVGPLGTVDGMIISFQLIADSETPPKAADLAKGIATALVTTLVGLLIAIPAIILFNILKNRIARLVLETGIVGEGLMGRFENVAPKK